MHCAPCGHNDSPEGGSKQARGVASRACLFLIAEIALSGAASPQRDTTMMLADVCVGVLLPVAVMFLLGWWIDRRFRLDLGTLVKLNIQVVVPAFIFYEVVRSDLHSALAWRVA